MEGTDLASTKLGYFWPLWYHSVSNLMEGFPGSSTNVVCNLFLCVWSTKIKILSLGFN
jgi:hypothetical protein